MGLFPRLARTSVLSARGRRDSDSKVLPSTELSQDSCARVETSQPGMVRGESPSTGRVQGRELYPEAHRPWHPVHGQCWAEHQRLAVLPVHREDPVARWEARCVRAGVRGDGGGEENRELRVPVWKNFEEDSYHRLWPVLMFSSAVLSFNGELFQIGFFC